jgi:hypothetical protein
MNRVAGSSSHWYAAARFLADHPVSLCNRVLIGFLLAQAIFNGDKKD